MPPKKRAQADTAQAPPQSANSKHAILSFLLNDSASLYSELQGTTYIPEKHKRRQPNQFDLIAASHDYTPFQHLVSAVVLSKPISSRLGCRTILTCFSEDFGYDTPGKLDRSHDELYQMLITARTQHRDKTSNQLAGLAQRVKEDFASDENDTSLSKMHERIQDDPAKLDAVLKSFNGIGDTGCEIFKRRIQVVWPEIYPFADERCLHAAAHLGLIDGEGVEELAEVVRKALPVKDEAEERKQFAVIVDSLVASDLENRLDEIIDRFSDVAQSDESKEKDTKRSKQDD